MERQAVRPTRRARKGHTENRDDFIIHRSPRGGWLGAVVSWGGCSRRALPSKMTDGHRGVKRKICNLTSGGGCQSTFGSGLFFGGGRRAHCSSAELARRYSGSRANRSSR